MDSECGLAKKCPDCGNVYAEDSKFCRKCGHHRAAKTCPDCGNVYAEDSKFCRKCGHHRARLAAECPDCGNVYAADSKYCRKCGKPRATMEDEEDEPVDMLKLKLGSSEIGSKTRGGLLVEEVMDQPTTATTPTNLYAQFDQESKAESFSPAGSVQSSYAISGANTLVVTSDIAKQHFEWSQELETVDQKQADLMMVQWKMIRDQTGMLAQQLIEIRKDLEGLKLQSGSTAARLDTHIQDSKGLEQRLGKTLRQACDPLKSDLARVSAMLEAESQKRAAEDADILRRLESLEASVGSSSLSRLEYDVSELRTALDGPLKQLPKLRDQLRQNADDWKNSHLMAMEHSTKLHDGLNRSLRELMLAHEGHRSDVDAALNQLRGSFQTELNGLRDHVNSRAAEMSAGQKDDPALRSRIQEMDDRIGSLGREHQRLMDMRLKDKDGKLQELERGLEGITSALSQESQARQSLAEVFEQMLKAERTKLVNMMTQKAACARLDNKELQKALMDLLTKESSERHDQATALKEDLQSLINSLGDRLGGVEGDCHGLQQQWHGAQVSLRGFESQLRKLESAVESCVVTMRTEVKSSIDKERNQREMEDNTIKEQVDLLEGFHKHMREFYINRSLGREARMADAVDT
eukprot:TRINITY_DN62061_c0_g1_i1.p1 TRINITY_DN62061_c0_g1~~TRINITY_DN62061_c0_g1_i1.p1  ORF type:complete len:636 (-),score=167.71 TRINITY_DN62061_c0_g1_i1:47-1954(-)